MSSPSPEGQGEPTYEVVYIARCHIHGLHGERTTCFVCAGPVERVPMRQVGPSVRDRAEHPYSPPAYPVGCTCPKCRRLRIVPGPPAPLKPAEPTYIEQGGGNALTVVALALTLVAGYLLLFGCLL